MVAKVGFIYLMAVALTRATAGERIRGVAKGTRSAEFAVIADCVVLALITNANTLEEEGKLN